MRLYAYTDGACKNNPGPGGWGVVLIARDTTGAIIKERELRGYDSETTNNRMEMTAAIAALDVLDRPTSITIRSDSKYVIEGITKWINGWRARNWRIKSGQPVKNKDLWIRLDALNQKHDVTWKWIKGHAGYPINERVDQIAVQMRDYASGKQLPNCLECGVLLDEIPFEKCLTHDQWEMSMWDTDAILIEEIPQGSEFEDFV